MNYVVCIHYQRHNTLHEQANQSCSTPPSSFPKMQSLNITAEFPKAHITLLPNEIIFRILYELYSSKSPITPFITTCKIFYNDFEYLLYVIRPFKLVENHYYKALDTRSASIIQRLSREDGFRILRRLPALDVEFITRPRKQIENCCYLEKLMITNMVEKQILQKLKVLNLTLNSLIFFTQLLQNLPVNLVVLKVVFDKIKSKDFNASYSRLKAFSNLKTTHSPPALNTLEYFIIRFHNSSPVTNHSVHPELATYSDRRRHTHSEEQRNYKNVNSRVIRAYHSFKDRHKKSNRTKLLFGTQINRLIFQNCLTLKKIEILGIDLDLIFQEKLTTPKFSSLRLFSFDNTSRVNMGSWLDRLQRENGDIPWFLNKAPLLVLFDSMGECLYFKPFLKIRELESVPELSIWSCSEEYRSTYAFINISRSIKV